MKKVFENIYNFLKVIKYSDSSEPFLYRGPNEKTISILANGPSLSASLNELLQKDQDQCDYFVVNDFALSSDYVKVAPKYYIFMDNARWDDRDNISEKDYQNREKTFEAIKNLTTWNMSIFVPSYVVTKHKLDFLLENTNIQLVPFRNFSLMLNNSKLTFKFLKNNYCAPFNNVLAGAIYCAINLGYKNIYLYGADHSWTKDLRVNDDNQVCIVKRHFWDGNNVLEPWLKSTNVPYKLSEILLDLFCHFRSYEILEEYSRQVSAHVVNCTPNSFIDAFEKA